MFFAALRLKTGKITILRQIYGNAKVSFYHAANAVFAKISGVASLEVTLQLIKSKCLPVKALKRVI